MIVEKKNSIENFNRLKIRNAIIQAYCQIDMPDFNTIDFIVDKIEEELKGKERTSVGEIENLVISYLYKYLPEVGREYSAYKIKRENSEKNPTEIEKVLMNKDDVAKENANKNSNLTHIQNAYLAEIPSKQAMREALPKDCLEAHDRGVVYQHDLSYAFRKMSNCRLLNLDYLLQHGCEINSVWVEKPKSFKTACTITTQILTHVAGNSYGLK